MTPQVSWYIVAYKAIVLLILWTTTPELLIILGWLLATLRARVEGRSAPLAGGRYSISYKQAVLYYGARHWLVRRNDYLFPIVIMLWPLWIGVRYRAIRTAYHVAKMAP